ncbi:MAG: hypothetical protein ACREQM_21625, partial [Candidatus Dormibacteraceae bacterium]
MAPCLARGILAVIAEFLFRATALAVGSIVVVQPILAGGLPLRLLLACPSSRVAGRREIAAA